MREAVGRLQRVLDGLLRRQELAELVLQRFALQKLRDDVRASLVGADVVDDEGVGVVEDIRDGEGILGAGTSSSSRFEAASHRRQRDLRGVRSGRSGELSERRTEWLHASRSDRESLHLNEKGVRLFELTP